MSRMLSSVLLGSALALAAGSAAAADPNATLTVTSGNVSVNQGQEFVPAASQMRVGPGDRVMVSANSSATIVFDDECRMEVTESTVITVPSQSTCAGATVVRQGISPGSDAAIGSTGTGNGGVWAMVAIVAAIDIWWLSDDEDEDDTVSP